MSSFSNPHYMYLFDLKNGKKKLAYGESPDDALRFFLQSDLDALYMDGRRIHRRPT